MIKDIRYALRVLARTPGSTVVALLSLALGIGVNATVFVWTKAVMLRPLPAVKAVSSLVVVSGMKGEREGLSNSFRDYIYIRDHNTVFDGVTAYDLLSLNLSSEGSPELVWGGIVSNEYFDVLGVKTVLGRTFLPEEGDFRLARPVVVLGYSLWSRRFARDPSLLGKTITLNRHRFTVIGIAPKGFVGNFGGLAQELWVPLMMQPLLTPGADQLNSERWLQIMGRLKVGITVSRAQAEFHVLASELQQVQQDTNKGLDFRVSTLDEAPRGIQSMLALFLPILMAATGFVLLIACANVASLMLSGVASRFGEFAVRTALGANRIQLIRQLLIECSLLTIMSGALGFLLTIWTSKALVVLVPLIGVPLGLDLSLDGSVFVFVLLTTLLTSLVLGLATALFVSKSDVFTELRRESGTLTGGVQKSRVRSVFVVGQTALAFMCLVSAGLLVRSLQMMLVSDPGFDTRSVLLESFDLFLNGYDGKSGQQFCSQLLERLKSLPGVRAASISSYVPMGVSGGNNSRTVAIEGYVPQTNESMDLVSDSVGPEYFETMRIPLVGGRDFTFEDRDGSPGVVIVNDTMSRRYWPNHNPLGKRIKVGAIWREVIGIARDITYGIPGEENVPRMYLPAFQDYVPQLTLIVRTDGHPYGLAPLVESTVHQLDPNLGLYNKESLIDHTHTAMLQQRIASALLSVFAVLALILAGMGVYGVMAYSVHQRRNEFGIRVALGARRRDVLKLVISRSATLTILGVGLGLGGALGATQVLSGMLYRVRPTDPVTLVAVSVILSVISLLAAYVPARRAVRIDPARALRYQ